MARSMTSLYLANEGLYEMRSNWDKKLVFERNRLAEKTRHATSIKFTSHDAIEAQLSDLAVCKFVEIASRRRCWRAAFKTIDMLGLADKITAP